jgi:hypothetical protein
MDRGTPRHAAASAKPQSNAVASAKPQNNAAASAKPLQTFPIKLSDGAVAGIWRNEI